MDAHARRKIKGAHSPTGLADQHALIVDILRINGAALLGLAQGNFRTGGSSGGGGGSAGSLIGAAPIRIFRMV